MTSKLVEKNRDPCDCGKFERWICEIWHCVKNVAWSGCKNHHPRCECDACKKDAA